MRASNLLELWRKVTERQDIVAEALDFSQSDQGMLDVASLPRLRLALVDLENAVSAFREELAS